MNQGKGRLWGEHICRECGQCIRASADGVTYWAYERWSAHYDGRAYYHRSCARRVSAQRVAERERNMAELRAAQQAQKPQPTGTARKAGRKGGRP